MVLCFICSVWVIFDSFYNVSVEDGYGKKWSVVKYYKFGKVVYGVYQFILYNFVEGLIVYFDNFCVKEVWKVISNWNNLCQY